MRSRIAIIILVLVAVAALVVVVELAGRGPEAHVVDRQAVLALPADPQSASYLILGSEVRLSDGEAVHDGASYEVVHGPVYGVLQSDEGRDAALVIEQTRDGSSALFVAAALWRDNGYVGSNALPVSSLRALDVSDDLITVSLEDGGSRYYTLTGGYLEPVLIVGDARLVRGDLDSTGDGFALTVCGDRSYDVDQASRTYATLSLLYREVLARRSITTGPIYVVVVGRVHGTEAGEVIAIDRIIAAPSNGACPMPDEDVPADPAGTSSPTSTAEFL